MTTAGTDSPWLQQALDLATRNVAEGGGPFAAVIVRDAELVAAGRNRVTATLDPTAHGEVTAIRDACRTLGVFALEGCTLYTSCEPCPMCLAASLWARLDRVVYAADRDDAAAVGFDDRAFYDLFEGGAATADRSAWPTSVHELRLEGRLAPFEAWRDCEQRVDY